MRMYQIRQARWGQFLMTLIQIIPLRTSKLDQASHVHISLFIPGKLN